MKWEQRAANIAGMDIDLIYVATSMLLVRRHKTAPAILTLIGVAKASTAQTLC